MSDKKPTPAQMRALRFVKKHGQAFRPDDYYGYTHGVNVKRDVWYRCHEKGWLKRPDSAWNPSKLTPAGELAVKGEL